MRRRTVLSSAVAVLGAPGLARAQPRAMPRIGVLLAREPEPAWTLLRKAMAELGHVEGRTVAYEYRPTGSDESRLDRLVAGDVDKVLKGIAPRDLPVQQAARMELVVNQRTAKMLGMVLPLMFLAQADEVIG